MEHSYNLAGRMGRCVLLSKNDQCVSLSAVCEGSTLKCALGQMSLSRSRGQTLIAAASTMAFFAAFNWQFAPIISSTPGTWKRWFKHIALALAEPFYAYAYSMLSAFIMWCAWRKLPRGKRGWGQDVAIILNCPLFIQIPSAYSATAKAVYLQNSTSAEAEGNAEILRDAEIRSESFMKTESPAVDPNADQIAVESSPHESINEETMVLMQWMKGLQIENETAIKQWHAAELPVKRPGISEGIDQHSAELPAKPSNDKGSDRHDNYVEGIGSDHDHCAELPAKPGNDKGSTDHYDNYTSEAGTGSDHDTKERYYIKLNPSPFYSREVHERFLLLQLDLVPEYEQIRFLRSRSTFQAVVTTLQALGYVFGVAQRMVAPAASQVRVSPLEAILSAFNVLVILQLLFNLYSCVHYQRPLLLRLERDQFSAYFQHPRHQRYKLLRYPFLDPNTSKIFLSTGAFISLLLLTMIQFAFIRYALSYLHTNKCLLCSLSAFIFCLLALSAVILIGILNSKKFRDLSAQAKLSIVIRIYSSIVNTASIAFALAATIISWKMFNRPNVNPFAWIVPHVSS